MIKKFLSLALALLATGTPGINAQNLRASSESIYDIASGDGNFSSLATAIDVAGLKEVLDCEQFYCRSFTAFAPNNDAFAALPPGLVEKLLNEEGEWKHHLKDLLLYHVTFPKRASSSIDNGDRIFTLLPGEKVNATVTDGSVKINDATVVTADIEASNGIIHVLDGVLVPPFLTKDIIDVATEKGHFNTLLAAVDAAGLTDALKGEGPFTLFAPTDKAFEKLPAAVIEDLLEDTDTLSKILQYHVVSDTIIEKDEIEEGSVPTLLEGSNIEVTMNGYGFLKCPVLNGDVKIIIYDILTSNGIIHVISDVLVPPEIALPIPSIVEHAQAEPSLSNLTTFLGEASLVPALSGEGPFTVFAPSNEAFDKVIDLVESLDVAELADVLKYHVVEGKVTQSDLEEGNVTTLSGEDVQIDLRGWYKPKAYVNNKRIKKFDIEASNGVIHLIDDVLLPPLDVVSIARASGFSLLATAIEAAGLEEDLKGEGPFTVFAPTDKAFEALGETLTGLLEDPPALKNILLYHVVAGKIDGGALESLTSVETLQEGTISVESESGWLSWLWGDTIKLNSDTTIIKTDIGAANGIIHIIDSVLIPPESRAFD